MQNRPKKLNEVEFFCGKEFLIEEILKAIKNRTFLVGKGKPNVTIKTNKRYKISLTLWDAPFKEPSAFVLVKFWFVWLLHTKMEHLVFLGQLLLFAR